MRSILQFMISRLLHSDPDLAGGGGGDGGDASGGAQDMDSTIGALFDKLQSEGRTEPGNEGTSAESGTTEEEQDPAAEANSAARARDASGKFTKAAIETEKPLAVTPDPNDKTVKPAITPEVPPAQAVSKFAEAPRSWSAVEKAAWAGTPEEARAAAYRREEDFHRGIEQYRGKAGHFDALHAVISPHAEIFKQSGQNAVENISGLLNLQQVLFTGSDDQKIGTLLQIVENVGIKRDMLLAGLQNPKAQPAHDPRVDSLARETMQLRQQLSQVQQAPLLNEVQKFWADPANEYLSEPGVFDLMMQMIQSGVAANAQEAYDKACRLSDPVQAKVSAKKADAERKAQAEREAAEAKRKADQAAKAKQASSINVKPLGATAGRPAKGTMEDTIGSIYDRLHGSRN